MLLCKVRFAFFPAVVLMALILSMTGCGKAPSPSKAHAARNYSSLLDVSLTGNWLETACNEGDSGPDLPPPAYSKGIIKFGDHVMRWSSRLYDDRDCKNQRSGAVTETVVPYTLTPDFKTTDGSVAIDVQIPQEDGTTLTMYGLVAIDGGTLYMAMFDRASVRPKSINRSKAQAFAQM
jgi:hypothetical protein